MNCDALALILRPLFATLLTGIKLLFAMNISLIGVSFYRLSLLEIFLTQRSLHLTLSYTYGS